MYYSGFLRLAETCVFVTFRENLKGRNTSFQYRDIRDGTEIIAFDLLIFAI